MELGYHPPAVRKGTRMEKYQGTIIVNPDPGGVDGELARGPIMLGPEHTANGYLAMVGSVPLGDPGPPLHRHPYTDEGFYIAEGEMTFEIGGEGRIAGAGSFVFIPRGTVHTAHVSGTGPMRGLLILSPGDAEHIVEPVNPE
jgi:quercetin dioxygenase-like cupin family protein